MNIQQFSVNTNRTTMAMQNKLRSDSSSIVTLNTLDCFHPVVFVVVQFSGESIVRPATDHCLEETCISPIQEGITSLFGELMNII